MVAFCKEWRGVKLVMEDGKGSPQQKREDGSVLAVQGPKLRSVTMPLHKPSNGTAHAPPQTGSEFRAPII